jgi:hypothetical protein
VAAGSRMDLKLTDEFGQTVFGIAFISDGTNVKLYELTQNGITMNVLASLLKETENTLKIEYCPSRRTANVYVNGNAVYVTNVNYDDATLNNKMMTVIFESVDVNAYIDNLYAEAVNTVFVQCKPTVTGGNKEDTATKYTFEQSSAVNIPKKVTKDFKSSGAALRIRSMLRDGAISNTLAFTTTNGNCDTLRFGTMNTAANANCATFEADVYFEDFVKGQNITQFNIGDVYMFHVAMDKNGNVTLGALTAGGGSGRVWGKAVTICSENQWVHLKIEAFLGDANSTIAKVYVNDALVLVTNNYKGYRTTDETPAAPSNNTTNAYLYTYTAGDGTVHFDNVSYTLNVTQKGEYELTDARP